MIVYKVNDKAKRADNGRIVRILEAIPNGLRVFYLTEDCADEHTAIVEGVDLRPVEQGR